MILQNLKSYFKTLLSTDTLTALRHKQIWNREVWTEELINLARIEAIVLGLSLHWIPGVCLIFGYAFWICWQIWLMQKVYDYS
jgi:hypothetical protein